LSSQKYTTFSGPMLKIMDGRAEDVGNIFPSDIQIDISQLPTNTYSQGFNSGDDNSSEITERQLENKIAPETFVRRQLDNQQIVPTQLLFQQKQQQQQQHNQQNEAFLTPDNNIKSLFGTPSLLANNNSIESAVALHNEQINQQINILRAQASLNLHNSGVQEMIVNQKKLGNKMLGQSDFDNMLHKNLEKYSIPIMDTGHNPGTLSDNAKESDSFEGNKDELALNDQKESANETFPQKLYRMIEEAESEGLNDVISFSPHGRVFAIHKPRQFITEFMPRYFSTSRMSSFQRQLNLYGFRRVKGGTDKGGYYHELFLNGQKELCRKIKRKKSNLSRKLKLDSLNRRTYLEKNGIGFLSDGRGSASPGFQDATNRYDMQMLQSSTGRLPELANYGIVHTSNNESGIVPIGESVMGQSALINPFQTLFQPMEQLTNTSILEKTKIDLLIAQMQQKQHEQKLMLLHGQRPGEIDEL